MVVSEGLVFDHTRNISQTASQNKSQCGMMGVVHRLRLFAASQPCFGRPSSANSISSKEHYDGKRAHFAGARTALGRQVSERSFRERKR